MSTSVSDGDAYDHTGAGVAQPENGITIEGITAGEPLPDPAEILARMSAKSREIRRLADIRKRQFIRFDRGPIGISFVADQHIGSDGSDYDRMFREAELIAKTPNLYVIQVGDLIDNFIVTKLLKLRLQTSFTIPEEWSVANYYLTLIGPKLLAMAGGNHDAWTTAMAGVDQLRQTLKLIRPEALYHTDELAVKIQVGDLAIAARIRHKWRFSSVYNPTHGIERSFERDQAIPFMLGVGAHTHISGLARQFNAGGKTGLAVICGTYKFHDSFATTQGFPTANGSTAVTVVFHPQYGMVGHDSLESAVSALKGDS